MATTSKIPVWMKVSRLICGTMGFVALALGVFSMFVRVSFQDNTRFVKDFTVLLSGGNLGLTKDVYVGWPDHTIYTVGNRFPDFIEAKLYFFRYLKKGAGWAVDIPLVTIGLIFLLIFFGVTRKLSKMRRNALLAAISPNQEP